MHDAPAFVLHFHLFFRVTGVEECIDMREHIESDLRRVNFFGGQCARAVTSATCWRSSRDRLRAGAGDGLIAGRDDARDAESLMQRPQTIIVIAVVQLGSRESRDFCARRRR